MAYAVTCKIPIFTSTDMNLPPKIQEYAIGLLRLKNNVVHRKEVIQRFGQTQHTVDLDKVIEYNDNRPYGYQRYLCNAPFASLYFDVHGQAIACCKNRQKILGYVKDQSIEAIWNGPEAQELRDAIANNNFDLGCRDCQNGILANNYASVMAMSYDNIQANRKLPYPKRMDFELSSTCNLACVMCSGFLSSTYRKHFEHEAPYPDAYDRSFVDKLRPFLPHLHKANFYGGEPFLIDLYYEIWEAMLQTNPSTIIFIQTNGHVLNNKVKTLLEKGRFHFGISFESLNPETYEKIRLYGKFDKLMRHIEFFRDYCRRKKTHFSLAITPLRSTIDELPEFVRFANKLDAIVFFNILTEPHDHSLWALDPETLAGIENKLNAVQLPDSTPTERSNLGQYRSYISQIARWREESEQRVRQLAEFRELPAEQIRGLLILKLQTYITSHGGEKHEEAGAFLEQLTRQIDEQMLAEPEAFRRKMEFFCAVPEERFVYEFILRG